ncbi:hypothetical protein ElyMa_000540000 [Elysia marginata]|uniref:LRRCT domain-containing protein n=1 Tax=Elysia marginata TaxID=1093978 RepID=A0AAV4G1F4_9GAST|nr:hypothetical protein ElyMa_000540000 [Elysia marginata]
MSSSSPNKFNLQFVKHLHLEGNQLTDLPQHPLTNDYANQVFYLEKNPWRCSKAWTSLQQLYPKQFRSIECSQSQTVTENLPNHISSMKTSAPETSKRIAARTSGYTSISPVETFKTSPPTARLYSPAVIDGKKRSSKTPATRPSDVPSTLAQVTSPSPYLKESGDSTVFGSPSNPAKDSSLSKTTATGIIVCAILLAVFGIWGVIVFVVWRRKKMQRSEDTASRPVTDVAVRYAALI